MVDVYQEILAKEKKPTLLVLSGPTCSGKDTIMRLLVKRNKNMRRLVTTNSRPKRSEEREGTDYHFISRSEFEKLIAQEAFYEWVEYRGEYRGGQKRHVHEALQSGKDVIWRIDVRGVKNIYKKVKKEIPNSVFVFLVESLGVLKARMAKRATEDKKWKEWSINMATWELKQYQDFDYVVPNKEGKLKEATEVIEKILEAEKLKVRKY
jgi:guanylate kinase